MSAKTSLEQWTVLAAVIDCGGFAQAAARLHRSQSAISYTLGRLQDELGLPLLVLEGRKSVLTPHGRTLLARARGLIQDLDTLEGLAKSLRQGWEADLKLVVDAAYPRETLLDTVAMLQGSCPTTQIQLSDAVLSGAEQAISEMTADVVITSRVPPGYLGERLLDVEFVAVARSDHALLQLGRALTIQDLVKHVQAVVRDSGTTQPRDEGWLGAEHRFTVSSMEASLATVVAGLAFAWLPKHMLAPFLEDGSLRRLPLESGGMRVVSLYIVLVRPESAGPAARAALTAFGRMSPTPTHGAA